MIELRNQIAKIIVKHAINQNCELFPNPIADEIIKLINKQKETGKDGPGEEDGPWSAGWEKRSGINVFHEPYE